MQASSVPFPCVCVSFLPCVPTQRNLPCVPSRRRLPCVPSQGWLPCVPSQRRLPCVPSQRNLPCVPSQRNLPCVPSQRRLPCVPSQGGYHVYLFSAEKRAIITYTYAQMGSIRLFELWKNPSGVVQLMFSKVRTH